MAAVYALHPRPNELMGTVLQRLAAGTLGSSAGLASVPVSQLARLLFVVGHTGIHTLVGPAVLVEFSLGF